MFKIPKKLFVPQGVLGVQLELRSFLGGFLGQEAVGRAGSVSKRSRFMGEWPGCGGNGVPWVGSFRGMCSTNWGATATAIPRPVPLIVPGAQWGYLWCWRGFSNQLQSKPHGSAW